MVCAYALIIEVSWFAAKLYICRIIDKNQRVFWQRLSESFKRLWITSMLNFVEFHRLDKGIEAVLRQSRTQFIIDTTAFGKSKIE